MTDFGKGPTSTQHLRGIQPAEIKLIGYAFVAPDKSAQKNGHPQLERMPVRDAIASPLNICVFSYVPASQQRRFSFDSISLAGEIPSLLWVSPSFCLLALASWHLQVLGLRA
jgi:hypothetical protein